jgi:ankyrin repeat protein
MGAIALNALYYNRAIYEQRPSNDAGVLTAPTASESGNPSPAVARDMSVTPLMENAGNGNCGEVLRLIKEGARVNAVNAKGTDALIYAASAGHLDCVLHLLNARASTDTVDRDGDSALSAARQQGHQKIVEAIETAKP